MTQVERQILLNQIAIMASLKEHMILQHGYADALPRIRRLEDAVTSTVALFREPGKSAMPV